MIAMKEVIGAVAKMHTIVMEIGPDQAMQMLEFNTRNRPLDQKHVDSLATEMKAGRWKLTHEAIAFDVNGVLQDGQHRLWAIALSGCTVPMNVTVNTPVDCIEYVGGGKVRRASERMSLSGHFEGGVNKDQLATLRAMVRGLGADRRLPFCREMDLLARHKTAVDFAVGSLWTNRVKGVGSSTTRAVVARAWYSVDLDELRRFCEVLRSGMAADPVEGNIILLRDYLSRLDRSNTLANLREQYGRVERALQAYLCGKILSVLRPCQTEIYPLPEEAQA
jgi:hypothetical protein